MLTEINKRSATENKEVSTKTKPYALPKGPSFRPLSIEIPSSAQKDGESTSPAVGAASQDVEKRAADDVAHSFEEEVPGPSTHGDHSDDGNKCMC